MPIEPIPITTPLNKDVDEVGLTTYGAAKINGYVDLAGGNRFPGLSIFCNLGTDAGVDGLYWWPNQSKVIAVSKGKTFLINDSLGDFDDISGDLFQLNKRPTFADFGSAVYAANGGKIVKVPSSGTTAYLADADAPTTVSHVAAINGYLLANKVGTQIFHFAETGTPETWPGNFASAEAQPDLIQSVGVANERIYLFGTETTEVWRNDGSTPFVREYQGHIQRGTIAKNSVIWGDGTWYWLDDYRQVVRLNGLQVEVLSLSINKYIQQFGTVSDAVGDYGLIDGRPYYFLHFPTEGKTLVLDLLPSPEGYQWYELGRFANGTYDRWIGNAYCLAKGWNYALVGDRRTGLVYKISGTYFDNAGETLRTMVRTGHVTRGTMRKRKRSFGVTFRLKRTQSTATQEGGELRQENGVILTTEGGDPILAESIAPDYNLIVRWRDNGTTTYSNERTIPLTRLSDTDFRATLTRCGMYYSRQWEFYAAESAPLVLVSAEEEFEYV